MSIYEDFTAGKITVTGSPGAIGTTANVAGLSVKHKVVGPLVQSVFTFTDMVQAVVNGTEYQSTKLYDFPKGVINVMGAVLTIQQKTTSDVASTLNASKTGAVGVGTVTASSTTLSTTMQDIIPTTAFTTSATTNTAGTAVSAQLAAAAQFDGTTTAKSLFLSTAYATTADVDADATQTLTGTLTVTWLNIGAY